MRRNKAIVCAGIFSLTLFLFLLNPTQLSRTATIAFPLDEIRFIMKTRALKSPDPKSLAALKRETLQSDLRAIDPYARYIPFIGEAGKSTDLPSLGIEVFFFKSRIWIRPDPDGPAAGAGVPEIGELRAINKRPVSTKLAAVSDQLDTARHNSPVILTVSNVSGGVDRDYPVRPADFKAPSVTWHRNGNRLILRITEFVSHDTSPGVYGILATQVRPDTQVILDLRGCSGGDLYEALDVAGLFVPAGLPLAETYDRSGLVRSYRSPVGRKTTVPVWLLIDSRTASAAEVLAGTLQYHRRALLVGERSFGKCVSQTMAPLSNGGGLWLTNLGIRFPDGASCAGTGVKPDISHPDVSICTVTAIFRDISDKGTVPAKPTQGESTKRP